MMKKNALLVLVTAALLGGCESKADFESFYYPAPPVENAVAEIHNTLAPASTPETEASVDGGITEDLKELLLNPPKDAQRPINLNHVDPKALAKATVPIAEQILKQHFQDKNKIDKIPIPDRMPSGQADYTVYYSIQNYAPVLKQQQLQPTVSPFKRAPDTLHADFAQKKLKGELEALHIDADIARKDGTVVFVQKGTSDVVSGTFLGDDSQQQPPGLTGIGYHQQQAYIFSGYRKEALDECHRDAQCHQVVHDLENGKNSEAKP